MNRLLLVLVVVGGVFQSACVDGVPYVYRPECPTHEGFLILVRPPADTVRITSVGIAGPISTVPEYHDCQRLIIPGAAGDHFGPMVAIFARNGLGAAWDTLIALETAGVPARALAVAEVFSYDGDYEALGIKKGFNCLYMYTQSTPVAHLPRAFMLPVEREEDCKNPQTTELGHSLEVTPTAYPGLLDKDYPNAARWDQDQKADSTYIGLKCGTAWCEVAGWTLESSPPLDVVAGDPPGIRQVKGWYDRQRLAIPNSAWTAGMPESEKLVPSNVYAVVAPTMDLNRVDSASYEGQWVPVANIELEAPLLEYREKLGLTFPGRNKLSYCRGDRTTCKVVGTPVCAAGLPDDKDPWYAKIESSTTSTSPSTTTYKCMKRNRHDNVDLPGTTRWRWLIEDEGIWGRCPFGCCPVT